MAKRIPILIVDASAEDRQAVRGALRGEAAEMDGVEADVREAQTLAEARAAIAREEFACVLLDHEMPDGGGRDLLVEMRAQGDPTPVIMLTGRRDERAILELMRAGASDHIPKTSLRPEFVVRSLRAALHLRQSQGETRDALGALHVRDRALAAAASGIVIADARQPDCPLIYVNPAFLTMTGYTLEEVIGRNCRFLQGAGTDPDAVRELREALRAERACEVTLLNHRRDGTPFWNELAVSPVWDGRGELTHFVGVQTDVTKRRTLEVARDRAEAALRESAERFRQMADVVPNIVWTAKPDGGLDYCNQRWYDYTGLTSEGTQGWNWLRVIHPDEMPKMIAIYRAAVTLTTGYEDEFRLRRADGEYRWHLGRGVPIKNEVGDVVKWVGTCTDITERRVAEQAQAALLDRERNIATQLQAALTPPIPERVPGMALTKYYEAALDEAGVGGDFYDVFPVDQGRTALVVGDLSGKGLAAAAQVATVRNMLRYALYRARTLSGALEGLSTLLAEQELLTGFATLFVGAFDSNTGTLSYINAGQEPALVRRAGTGQVEQLSHTGPVLGVDANAAYEEGAVALAPGDALAVFTDGVTECGASRREMLGIEGATALLRRPFAPEEAGDAARLAEAIALRLVAGVDAASHGGVAKDDLCLLVGVVDGQR